MNFLQQALEFIFTAQHWTGRRGWASGSPSTCSTP